MRKTIFKLYGKVHPMLFVPYQEADEILQEKFNQCEFFPEVDEHWEMLEKELKKRGIPVRGYQENAAVNGEMDDRGVFIPLEYKFSEEEKEEILIKFLKNYGIFQELAKKYMEDSIEWNIERMYEEGKL